jgi:hypothetical protein
MIDIGYSDDLAPEQKMERVSALLTIVDSLHLHEWFESFGKCVVKWGIPKSMDKEFVCDAMIEYYKRTEDYEMCALSIKAKLITDPIDIESLSSHEILELVSFGYELPITKVIHKLNNKDLQLFEDLDSMRSEINKQGNE